METIKADERFTFSDPSRSVCYECGLNLEIIVPDNGVFLDGEMYETVCTDCYGRWDIALFYDT